MDLQLTEYCIFQTVRLIPTANLGGKWRYVLYSKCSLPGSLAGEGGGAGSQEAGAGPHFLLQIFFPYFPPLKPRCVLWSDASYSPKNTGVCVCVCV